MNFPGCHDQETVLGIIRRQLLTNLAILSTDGLQSFDYMPGTPDQLCDCLVRWLSMNDGLYMVKAWNDNANSSFVAKRNKPSAKIAAQEFTWRMAGMRSQLGGAPVAGVPATKEERTAGGYTEREYQQALELHTLKTTLLQIQTDIQRQTDYIEELEDELEEGPDEQAQHQDGGMIGGFRTTPWTPQDVLNLMDRARSMFRPGVPPPAIPAAQPVAASKLAGAPEPAAPDRDELLRAIERAHQEVPDEAQQLTTDLLAHYGDAAWQQRQQQPPNDGSAAQ